MLFRVKEVESATSKYLVAAIFIGAVIIISSIAVIKSIKINSVYSLLLFVIALLSFGWYIHIDAYRRKKKFNLYLCELKTSLDINYIKKNYTIVDINENYILFVDKGNISYFNDWKLLQGYDNLYKFALKF